MQTVEIKVSGMTCGACVAHVSKALQNVPGVQSAAVDLESASARVEGLNLDTSALLTAVEEEGYTAQPIEGAGQARMNVTQTNVIPLKANGCSYGG